MNKNSFSVKFIFSFGLFAFALMAQAQSQSNILLEACNNFKNSAKRSDCLKTAQIKATQSQTQATLKPTTETPLSIDGTAAICEKVLTHLVSRHTEATE